MRFWLQVESLIQNILSSLLQYIHLLVCKFFQKRNKYSYLYPWGLTGFSLNKKCLEDMFAFTCICNSIKNQPDSGSAAAVTGAALRCLPWRTHRSGPRSHRSYSQVSLLGWFVSEGALGNCCWTIGKEERSKKSTALAQAEAENTIPATGARPGQTEAIEKGCTEENKNEKDRKKWDPHKTVHIKSNRGRVVVVHTFNAALRRRDKWISELEASLLYKTNSRTARAL